MNHLTLPRFWHLCRQLPKEAQDKANKTLKLLANNPRHPSLCLKKVGKTKQLWSVRVGAHHRALGMDRPEGVFWFWIGSHTEYDKFLSKEVY